MKEKEVLSVVAFLGQEGGSSHLCSRLGIPHFGFITSFGEAMRNAEVAMKRENLLDSMRGTRGMKDGRKERRKGERKEERKAEK